jgi:hypothetical protein
MTGARWMTAIACASFVAGAAGCSRRPLAGDGGGETRYSQLIAGR